MAKLTDSPDLVNKHNLTSIFVKLVMDWSMVITFVVPKRRLEIYNFFHERSFGLGWNRDGSSG